MITTSMRRRALLTAICLTPCVFHAYQQSRDAAKTVATGTAEISGTVVADDATANPLRRATVTLTGNDLGGTRLIAVTDDTGRFAFTSLRASRYSLSVSKGGYLPSTYGGKRPGGPGAPIVVRDGQHVASLAMKLLKGSVLSGTVLDETGRPAPDVTVTALRYALSFRTGEQTLQPALFGSSQVTDDRGMFRIYGLEPGEYFVSASSSMRPNANPRVGADIHQITDADVRRAQQLLRESGGMPATQIVQGGGARPARSTVNYATVYHPSAIVLADATPITVGPREERAGVDVQLRMVPTARVEGATSGPDGTPMPGVSLYILDPGPQPPDNFAVVLRFARSDRDGRFVLPDIGPGKYTIMASVGAGPTSALWGMSEVSVEGHDVATSIVLAPGVRVSGRLVFEGALPPPPDLTTVLPILSVAQEGPSMFGLLPPKVEADGRFTFTVMPGKHRIESTFWRTTPAGWLLKSVMVNDTDITDVPFEIKPEQNVDGVVITLTDQRTEISGTMRGPTSQANSEYSIIVFSADKRFWLPRTRRTQQVRTGADGQFIVPNLPPGDYLISALTDVEQGQWNDPAFLAELAAHGPIKITLAEGEKKVQDIRVGGG